METKRYYELNNRYTIIDRELYNYLIEREELKRKDNLTEEEVISLYAMDGAYKQCCCKIRTEINVKNVLVLIPYINEKDEAGAEVILFDYELLSEYWNSWLKVFYDDEKELLYVEIQTV